jgi:hypothetical protein
MLWNRMRIKVTTGSLANPGANSDPIMTSSSQKPDFTMRCPIRNLESHKEWATILRSKNVGDPAFALAVIEGKPAFDSTGLFQACIAAAACVHQRWALGENSPYIFFGTVQMDIMSFYLMQTHTSPNSTGVSITARQLPDLTFDLGTYSGCAQFLVFSELLKELAAHIEDSLQQYCKNFLDSNRSPPTWWYMKHQPAIPPLPPTPPTLLPYMVPTLMQSPNNSLPRLSAPTGDEFREGGLEGFAEIEINQDGSVGRDGRPRCYRAVARSLHGVLKKKLKIFSAIRRLCGQQSQA